MQDITSLKQMLDLNTTPFENIVGRLKAFEERVADEEEETHEDTGKLMYTNADTISEGYGYNSRGRGRGGRSNWRGRGRGRGTFQKQREAYRQGRGGDASHITCFKCDKQGHYATDCLDKHLKLQETIEKKDDDTQEADTLMMHEVVYLNEKEVNPSNFESESDTMDVRYLDNGASNHMSGNRMFFFELDDTVTGKVCFGDDSRIDIMGKGSIRFIIKNGEKKVLKNVYYIPSLRSNIVSLGQATEAGCKVRMKNDTLTLYDRQGQLMVKTPRAKNRLYKLVLQVDLIQCLQVNNGGEGEIWHARLGHFNQETMRMMANKEIVTGLPSISRSTDTCVSCLRGKQSRKSFPQATHYRATKLFELVHADLCGPISPSTTAHNRYIFVHIDDHSRYMWIVLLKEKSEAFEKFKHFKKLVEQETREELRNLRTDRGGEFTSNEFRYYCEKHGVNRHLTTPYSPQQNGAVE